MDGQNPAQKSLDEVEYDVRFVGGGAHHWRPYALHGREALSTLHGLYLYLVTRDAYADPDALLGLDAILSIRRGTSERYLGGMVWSVQDLGATGSAHVVSVELVPRLQRLSLRSQCRVFVDLTVPAIVTQVLREHALYPGDERVDVLGERYPKRELTVQYNESDLTFVMRHLENAGIGFTFRHDPRGEALVLFDMARGRSPLGGAYECAAHMLDRGVATADAESIRDLVWERAVVPGGATVLAHDFTRPRVPTRWAATDAHQPGHGTAEHSTRTTFHGYGEDGTYHADDGAALARARQQAQSVNARVAVARGNVSAASAGGALRVSGHAREDLNRAYLVTAIEHLGVARGDLTHDLPLPDPALASASRYESVLTLVPDDVTWRPARVTPWPELKGPQTATVIRPPDSTDDVATDVWGRTLLRFHWESLASGTTRSCAWIRTSHAWAGPDYGVMTLLRAGMEVVVQFLGGDPDQPLITGCVYNGSNAPPLRLPDQATCSVFRSHSTPGRGCNEVLVDDRAGAEVIRVSAQLDFDLNVRRDRRERIERNDTVAVLGGRDVAVTGHDVLRVGRHVVIDVEEGFTVRCGASVLQVFPDRIVVSSPMVLMNCDGSVRHPDLGTDAPEAPR
jgi:type VI secretion system secreted protein VgrG